jgi:hypothetical protein
MNFTPTSPRPKVKAERKVRDREDALASMRDACATQSPPSPQNGISRIGHAILDNGVDIGGMLDVTHWIGFQND